MEWNISKCVTMDRTLPLVVAILVLQALWGFAFSTVLGPRTRATDNVVQNDLNESKYCYSCVKIDNICYNHSYLFELPAPFSEDPVVKRMAIMKATNVLYYNFEPTLSDKEYSKVGFTSLNNTKLFGVIPGWQYNFGPFDINQKEKKVYLGGSEGIWVVDDTRYVPRYFAAMLNFITNIFIKDFIYFTTSQQKGILKYIDEYNIIKVVDKTIYNFVFDVGYNIVYLNDTGLFISFHSNNKEDVKLSNEGWIRGLTVDVNGAVYAWHEDGIYKVTVSNTHSESTLKRVTIIAPDAMTFDESNNILYTIGKKLYKLTKVATSKCFGR
ncbi:uncharacterized protein LOC125236023 [Leguminivora glycinivorella]|uniref:uncharacterized protein LOC125236023 n=1 Tax=Leguminivora glycinivorella TaxID=1035111 RepID=UPI00200DD5A9|nr:uncharacterized protein LOC125236023 [Leguminivora glycinivorella]